MVYIVDEKYELTAVPAVASAQNMSLKWRKCHYCEGTCKMKTLVTTDLPNKLNSCSTYSSLRELRPTNICFFSSPMLLSCRNLYEYMCTQPSQTVLHHNFCRLQFSQICQPKECPIRNDIHVVASQISTVYMHIRDKHTPPMIHDHISHSQLQKLYWSSKYKSIDACHPVVLEVAGV